MSTELFWGLLLFGGGITWASDGRRLFQFLGFVCISVGAMLIARVLG